MCLIALLPCFLIDRFGGSCARVLLLLMLLVLTSNCIDISDNELKVTFDA